MSCPSSRCWPTVFNQTFKFCGDPRFIPHLKDGKFVLNLANNHIYNYGQAGFQQTIKYLDLADIRYVYTHLPEKEIVEIEHEGITLGILSLDFVSSPDLDKKQVLEIVSQHDPRFDWLIVSIHWGEEYKELPEAWRIKFGKQLIDAGADIIHGHHPHVWQDYEYYLGKPIFYSLGNFIFDQNWSKATSETNIVRLTLDKKSIMKIDLFPIQIRNNSQPVIVGQSLSIF